LAGANAEITKRLVDATNPDPTRDRFLWDDELRGFGLRVFPSGAKVYVLQYRVGGRGSQARRRVIARHGVVTPDEARNRARRLLADIADGNDPAAQRDQDREALTVSDLAGLYLKDGPAEKPNKKTFELEYRSLEYRAARQAAVGAQAAAGAHAWGTIVTKRSREHRETSVANSTKVGCGA
jgi:hypothetical protein